jgi:hypothetical protein
MRAIGYPGLAVMLVLMGPAALMAAPSVAGDIAAYQNPILYADYSDPDVLRVGKRYYLVASSFHFSPGIPVLESPDLVHWRIAGHVLPRLNFAPGYDMVPPYTLTDATQGPVGNGQRYGGGVWAPALRYHDHKFYVYWPTPGEGIFVSTASRMEGPWSSPVTVLSGPGYEDPCPFWDTDGKAYLIHAKVGAGFLILHRLSPDGTRVLDEGKTIVEDRANLPVIEGPKLYKRHGWYYIFAPIGGVGTGGEAVLRSRHIFGPYQWRVVLVPGQTAIAGPHQGGYVETPGRSGALRILSRFAGGMPGRSSAMPSATGCKASRSLRTPCPCRRPTRLTTTCRTATNSTVRFWDCNGNGTTTRMITRGASPNVRVTCDCTRRARSIWSQRATR